MSHSRTIDLPPFTLRERREGEGTPVVLLHGLSGSGSWWRRNVPALAQRHTVVSVDLPMLADFDAAASLVARWIEQQFDEPVHLIGHSMGGMLSIGLAAARPELVRSLVLAGATGIPFALDARAHLRHLARPPSGLVSFSRVLAWDFLRAGPAAVASTTASLLAADARQAMTHVRTPTLLIWGDRDPLVPERYGEEMQRTIAGSSLVILPEAGHVSMWDNPSAFNDAVLNFFTDVEGSEQDSSAILRYAAWGVAGCARSICYRSTGPDPRVVLVHGLGMSGSYFRGLARELERRGFEVAAPDLRGFGYSPNAPAQPANEHAADLVAWAEAIGLSRAVWIGHSTGCEIVREVFSLAPDLVAGSVYLSPIWSGRRRAIARLALALIGDVSREPLSLIPEVAANYWRVGLWRWLRTFRLDLRRFAGVFELPPGSVIVTGERDPLADEQHLRSLAELRVVAGAAHAVNFSEPAGIADCLAGDLRRWLAFDYTAER